MISRHLIRLVHISLIIGIATSSGCSGQQGGTVNVSGRVLVDDVPLANAALFFFTDEIGSSLKSIHGMTDHDGRYKFQLPATSCTYRVIVKCVPGQTGRLFTTQDSHGVDEGQQQAAAIANLRRSARRSKGSTGEADALPSIYTSPQRSILRVVVTGSSRTMNADLLLTMQAPGKNSVATKDRTALVK